MLYCIHPEIDHQATEMVAFASIQITSIGARFTHYCQVP